MRALMVLFLLLSPGLTACQQKADTPPAPKTAALTGSTALAP